MADEYPDDDEFELQYKDELEMMNDIIHQDEGKSDAVQGNQHMIESPQLSQITVNSATSQSGSAVSRRLFSTPIRLMPCGSSTPLQKTLQPMTSIKEVIVNSTEPTIVEEISKSPINKNSALDELQQLNKKRKRMERDLFGDIGDIDDEIYKDPIEKKAKTEEEKDLELIDKILAARRKHKEQTKIVCKDHVQRMKALQEFKLRNLSHSIPQWPFLRLRRSNDELIFVRFHSEQYETEAINAISVSGHSIRNLLGDEKQKMWQEANVFVSKRLICSEGAKENATRVSQGTDLEQQNLLWVEKYKPHKYIHLLSDEMTNRSLLFWLKMWDQVVFGKKFKALDGDVKDNVKLNSFNKRTGRFEVNGGWYSRRFKQNFNLNVDEYGRPVQKVALLCGAPGLGKTTLANIAAHHAGYNVIEINASDDRSLEAFQMILETGTQMSGVMNKGRRPNCLILDEIDGAPRQSIEYLVKYINGADTVKKTAKSKKKSNILKRPIICICNDLYDAALRPLRQVAFIINVPPIKPSTLAERLLEIAKHERLQTDLGSLIALAEKSACDVRSCISTMQFFSTQNKPLTLSAVLNSNLGQKDRRHGLFDTWNSIFRIKYQDKQFLHETNRNNVQIGMTSTSLYNRAKHILDVIHSAGDYERLIQGVHENFLQQKMPDPDFKGIVEAFQWFIYADIIQQSIQHFQNYALYPYVQYGFVKWHFLFASLAWPKIQFPTKDYDFYQKRNIQRNIFLALSKCMSSNVIGVGQGCKFLLDTISLLKRIISPQLRSVAVQLLSPKEQMDVKHTIEVMVDLGLTYTQMKLTEGSFTFRMEPDIDALLQFPDYPGITLSYFSRQLIAREVELERIHRSTIKIKEGAVQTSRLTSLSSKSKSTTLSKTNELKQNICSKNISSKNNKFQEESISKDFFGRIQHKKPVQSLAESCKSNGNVNNEIWYRYKEGFNNAIRKDITINELL